jgi:hypothetical protein
MKINANIAFSGGETSAYMTQRLIKDFEKEYNFVVTFANTGQESEKTLEFVDKFSKHFNIDVNWVEAEPQERGVGTKHKLVNYETASRDGKPFEKVIQKYGIPYTSFKHCSRELKTRPSHSFVKEYFKTTEYITFIGIRADEIDRMTDNPKIKYPLVDWGITKPYINTFWNSQPFRLNLKGYEGNCKTCWKKSKRKLMTIALERPEWFDFFKDMEEKYGNYRPPTYKEDRYQLPARFFRGRMSCEDLIAEANNTKFKLALDDKFEFTEIDLEGDCGSESCEPF